MTFRLRAAHASDIEPLYEMAKLTGGGFTNLPADRNALEAKLARATPPFRAMAASATIISCWCSRTPRRSRSAEPAS